MSLSSQIEKKIFDHSESISKRFLYATYILCVDAFKITSDYGSVFGQVGQDV
ncbi:MAG: hypothetical protein O3B41_01440 [Bacteroidetes bacterium]|nr:hypothetical protein [Bacteroidota bacterium]